MAGEPSPIAGTDITRSWLAVTNPDNPGERCWVPSADIEPLGDVSGLRMLYEPEKPTEEPRGPVCAASLNTGETCKAAGGTWKRLPTGKDGCVYP